MAAIEWDKSGERGYEYGVDHGVLYDENHTNGVAWNGLVSVETSRDFEVISLNYDSIKQVDVVSMTDLELTIEAYSMPIEFSPCLGEHPVIPGFFLTRQPRQSFGLAYRTLRSDQSYFIHLVYNATAEIDSQNYKTISSNVDPDTRKWKISTRPNPNVAYRPTSHLIVDSRRAIPENLAVLENILFGDQGLWIVNGGPVLILTYRRVINGGISLDTSDTILNGGTPLNSPYATPTLISPEEIKAVLEAV